MKTLRNYTQLVGRVGITPELKTFNESTQMCRVSIAVKEWYKDSKGEFVENTHWFNAISWGKTAAKIVERVNKGDEICINGRLKTNSFEDKNGNNQSRVEIHVEEFMLTATKKEDKAA